MRGREDIGCRWAEVRALCGKTTVLLSLTEDDEARRDCKGGFGQEIFQPLPALLPSPLRIDFYSVSSGQRRPQSSNRRIRRAVERGRKDDRILGRGNRGNDPPLQVERDRDGEDADARFRSLRLEPNDVVDQCRISKPRRGRRTDPSRSSPSPAFTTTALTRPPRDEPFVCSFHSGMEHRTLASTTRSGWTVVGLWGRGKLSEMPVLGGLKAERGRVGRDFGPLLRAPTPGETGGVPVRVAIAS